MHVVALSASERPSRCPWQVGEVRGVERSALRARLGHPAHVETDTSSTFGGEEDWWGYRNAAGTVVGICLRVPYEHVVVYFSEVSQAAVDDVRALLTPWTVEVFDSPYVDGPRPPGSR